MISSCAGKTAFDIIMPNLLSINKPSPFRINSGSTSDKILGAFMIKLRKKCEIVANQIK